MHLEPLYKPNQESPILGWAKAVDQIYCPYPHTLTQLTKPRHIDQLGILVHTHTGSLSWTHQTDSLPIFPIHIRPALRQSVLYTSDRLSGSLSYTHQTGSPAVFLVHISLALLQYFLYTSSSLSYTHLSGFPSVFPRHIRLASCQSFLDTLDSYHVNNLLNYWKI